jgi:zinc transport system ATP-binding protein
MQNANVHIHAKNLSFSYDKQNNVLTDVGFTLYKNEVAAIVGPNGGGKTTLLRLLAGLLKPMQGNIELNGQSRKPGDNARIVGYVPQYAKFDKHFPMTVYDVVLSGLIKSFGFYSKADKASADRALEYMELDDLKNRAICDLSGGQMQRMLIARALVSPKEILLLDEPTANIDQHTSDRLKELIKELSASLTILLVTHDTLFLDGILNRLFCVNRTLKEIPVGEHYCQLDSHQPVSFIHPGNQPLTAKDSSTGAVQ